MLLKVITEDPKVWSTWSRKYRAEGSGIPKVYVVRADGKQIYGKSGSPQALPKFLTSALNASGRIPSRAELTRLARELKTAQKAIDDGAIQDATTVLGRAKIAGVYAGSAIALRKLTATMVKQGQTALADANKKIEDPKTTFDGLTALVAVDRNYGRLPALRRQITAAVRAVRKDSALRVSLDRAKLVDRAQQYEADKKLKQASNAWQAVLAKFPKTASAKLAAERISDIAKQGVATSPAKSKPTTKKSTASRNEKRAASQLRLGKLQRKRNPVKARQYFENSIKLAPKSKIAQEAERLLRGL